MEVLYYLDSILPADSVEVIRNVPGDACFFAVATYLYDETNCTRSGTLDIYKTRLIDNIKGMALAPERVFSLEDCGGILDSKWWCDSTIGNDSLSSHQSKIRGSWATSSGKLGLGVFDCEEYKLKVDQMITLDSQSIIMANDVSDDGKLHSVALTDGSVVTVSLLESENLVTTLGKHSLEAWTVSFNPHHKHLLYSGGDDAKWITWDLRCSSETPPSQNSFHQAGVCTIQAHPCDENLIATGSYDRRCALWDRRSLKMPLQIIEAASGVWRVRWRPQIDDDHHLQLIAACMYDGFYFCDFSQPDKPILSKFRDESNPKWLAYGCCWLSSSVPLTCTFYNHQVQICCINKDSTPP